MRSRLIRLALPVVLIAAVAAGTAVAAFASMRSSSGTVMTVKSSKYGVVLVSKSGRTLYRFTPDSKGASKCKGACAAFWPPLVMKGAAKPTAGSGVNAALLGTMSRSKGVRQVTYAGYPLYLFSIDSKSGDVKGEGYKDFGGTWYVVNAKGALVKKPVSSSGGGSKSGWG